MRKLAVIGLTLAVTLSSLPPMAGAATTGSVQSTAQTGNFTFLHITDTHVGSWSGNTNWPKVVDDILKQPTKPAFALHGGDITELGAPAEYDRYDLDRQRLGIPVYHTPGNHDARWLDAAKQQFTGRYGQPYSSFTQGGVHFVQIDTSIIAETHGHIEKNVLAWLAADLKAVGPEMPVVVTVHHPIAYDASPFLDNDEDFLEVVKGYNVQAVFTGHGHLNLHWERNNIDFFMTAAAMDAGYKIVNVEEGVMQVYNQVAGGTPTAAEVIDLSAGKEKGQVRITSLTDQQLITGPFTVALEGTNLPNYIGEAVYRVDMGPWLPMQVGEVVGGGDAPGAPKLSRVTFKATYDPKALPAGVHELQVRLTDDDKATFTSRVRFQSAGGTAQLAWRFPAGGGIQSTPAFDGQRLIFGSNDGNLYAVKAADGRQAWKLAVGSAVVTSPLLQAGTVYAGTAAGRLLAVQPATGALVWQKELGEGILGTPALEGGKLYVSTASGWVYALNAADGSQIWRYWAGGALRTGPAVGGGAVYVGGWNQSLQAIEAATGKLRWRQPIGKNIYFSPANGTPVYHQGRVYVTAPNNTLYAFAALDGRTLWTADIDAGYSSPLIHGTDLVVGTLGGKVVGFDPATGTKRWEAATGAGSYDSSPRPFGGDLVMGGIWGRLSKVDRATAQLGWQVRLGHSLIFANPVQAGDKVVQGAMDGTLYAFRAPLLTAAPPTPPLFGDAVGHWAQAYIEGLQAIGLVSGYDGGFHPETGMTRGQFAHLIASYLGVKASATFQTQFTDLAGFWGADSIKALEEKGLISGTVVNGKKVFLPNEPLNRGAAAVMLAKALGLSAPSPGFQTKLTDMTGHWAAPQAMALEEVGLVSGGVVNGVIKYLPADGLTRAQASTLLARALTWQKAVR